MLANKLEFLFSDIKINFTLIVSGLLIPCMMGVINYGIRKIAILGTSFGNDILVLLLAFDASALANPKLIPNISIGSAIRSEILIFSFLFTLLILLISVGHFEKGYFRHRPGNTNTVDKPSKGVVPWVIDKYYLVGSWLFIIFTLYFHMLIIGWEQS